MMIQIKVGRTLKSCLLCIYTHMDLKNGQVKPHLQVLSQCPGYDRNWLPMIQILP